MTYEAPHKRSLFSVREGKFIGTLGLKSYLKKMRASRITLEIAVLIVYYIV
jgi:hypothetical protein